MDLAQGAVDLEGAGAGGPGVHEQVDAIGELGVATAGGVGAGPLILGKVGGHVDAAHGPLGVGIAGQAEEGVYLVGAGVEEGAHGADGDGADLSDRAFTDPGQGLAVAGVPAEDVRAGVGDVVPGAGGGDAICLGHGGGDGLLAVDGFDEAGLGDGGGEVAVDAAVGSDDGDDVGALALDHLAPVLVEGGARPAPGERLEEVWLEVADGDEPGARGGLADGGDGSGDPLQRATAVFLGAVALDVIEPARHAGGADAGDAVDVGGG